MRAERRGMFLAEFCLVVLTGTVLIAGTLSLGRLVLNRRRAYAAARLASLLASAGFDAQRAEAEAAAYWKAAGGRGTLRLTTGRYDRTAASRFYPLLEVAAESDAAAYGPLRERVVIARED